MNLKRALLAWIMGLTLALLGILGPILIAQAADPDPGLINPPLQPLIQPRNVYHLIGQAPAMLESGLAQTSLAQLPLRFIPNHGQTDPSVKFHVHSLGGSLFFSPQEIVFSLPTPVTEQRSGGAGGQGREKATSTPFFNRNSEIHARKGSPKSVVRLTFDGANPTPAVEGLNPLPGGANFFLGNDPAQWQSNLPTYAGIVYRDLYPGIDLVYRGTEGQLKSEFIVAPGADPRQIRLRYEGAESLSVREDGALVIQTAAGELVEAPLLIYQEVNSVRREIEGHYLLLDETGSSIQNPKSKIQNPLVSFQVTAYDPTLPLIIDPELVYSSYLGGGDYDNGLGITLDAFGNIFVTGQTASTNFPVQQPLQEDQPDPDVFITKIIKANGVYTYGYSTYLGGNGEDNSNDIFVDSTGNIYLTGYTGSVTDFPIRYALQNTCASCTRLGDTDVFVTKIISTSGVYTLGFSTYLGGSGSDTGYGIAVDDTGNIFVTGTAGANFPLRDGIQSFQGGNDAFVTKIISANGVYTYGYSSYLGGNNFDESEAIVVDNLGSIYIAGLTDSTNFPTLNAPQGNQPGRDAFVTKLISVSGVYTYGYSTYLGGSDYDAGYDLAIDSIGNAYIIGDTRSNNFPTFNQLQDNANTDNSTLADIFITKIISAGGVYTYAYSTYLGGNGTDAGFGVAVDNTSNAYIVGQTNSTNFPLRNVIQNMCMSFPSCYGGSTDAFITQIIGTSGIYTYGFSTYLGGSGAEAGISIAVDNAGSAYIIGHTGSTNFPMQNAIQGTISGGSSDVFVAEINAAIPALTLTKAVTPIIAAPGQRVTFTLSVDNSGTASATNVLISDTLPAGLTFAGPVTLDPPGAGLIGLPPAIMASPIVSVGQRITVTFPVTVNSGLAGGTVITNIAAATSAEVNIPATGTAAVIVAHPALTIVKSADASSANIGEAITYTYHMTNTGNVTLTGLTATDDKLGQVTLTQTVLAPNQSTSGLLTYTVAEADLPGPLTNTVIVTGTPSVESVVTATDEVSVALVTTPAITVSKTASLDTAKVGQTITYTYRITNSGNITLTTVSAGDDKLGQVSLSQTTLAPNQAATGTLTYNVIAANLPGPLVNTVIVTGTPPEGLAVTAVATASVALLPPNNGPDESVYLPVIVKNR
ncbi:MAG: hypothetical protein BroJett011_00860 [Chloroflexota bacterium]|nr:MAG: hypothetical protein BroJett011_00860 [Chloroflexota bacterium]